MGKGTYTVNYGPLLELEPPRFRAVIGAIVMGTSALVERELHRCLPRDVLLATSRVPLREVSPQGILDMVRRLPEAGQILMEAGPDVMMVTSITDSCIHGSEIRNVVQQATGIPVMLPSGALVNCLRQMGSRQIALVSAFSAELAMVERMFFERHGFHVKVILTNALRSRMNPFSMYYLDYDKMTRAVQSTFRGGADVVLFDHPAIYFNDGVGRALEQLVQAPVLCGNEAVLYQCLSAVGADTEVLYISRYLNHERKEAVI